MEALLALATLLAKGASKYGARTFELGLPFSRLYSAILRHVYAWASGDANQDHLAAVLFNACALRAFEDRVRNGKLPTDLADAGPLQVCPPENAEPYIVGEPGEDDDDAEDDAEDDARDDDPEEDPSYGCCLAAAPPLPDALAGWVSVEDQPKEARVRLSVGPVSWFMPYAEFGGSQTAQGWAERLREEVIDSLRIRLAGLPTVETTVPDPEPTPAPIPDLGPLVQIEARAHSVLVLLLNNRVGAYYASPGDDDGLRRCASDANYQRARILSALRECWLALKGPAAGRVFDLVQIRESTEPSLAVEVGGVEIWRRTYRPHNEGFVRSWAQTTAADARAQIARLIL